MGVAGYRIDLGVLDQSSPGRFICGIECDGVAYHASETARDRDRLRQQVLGARGWTIHRVWSTDWFKDRQGQIERLLSLIEEDRRRVREEIAAEKEARERASRENQMRSEAEARSKREEADEIIQSALISESYQRPVAALYTFTLSDGRYASADFFGIPLRDVARAVAQVIDTESPIHRTDLLTRVASMWGFKAGPRIQDRICDGV